MGRNFYIRWFISALCLVAASLLYLSVGASGIGLEDLWLVFAGQASQEEAALTLSVFQDIRLPRMVKCLISGGALAVAGVLTQGLFRNGLASPSVIGTGSGAGLFAAVSFYFGWAQASLWSLPLTAFAGALLFTLLLVGILKYLKSYATDTILLAGLALNIFCGALTTLFVTLTLEKPGQAPTLIHWLMGDFSYPSQELVIVGFVVTGACLFFVSKSARQLDAHTLGDEVGKSLGIDPIRLQYIVLVLVSLLIGTTVSLVGSAPFVGLIVPHISRMIIGPHALPLLWFSLLNGMTFVLLADVIAKNVIAPGEVPTGILLALVGAPFFLFLLIKGMHERYK